GRRSFDTGTNRCRPARHVRPGAARVRELGTAQPGAPGFGPGRGLGLGPRTADARILRVNDEWIGVTPNCPGIARADPFVILDNHKPASGLAPSQVASRNPEPDPATAQ